MPRPFSFLGVRRAQLGYVFFSNDDLGKTTLYVFVVGFFLATKIRAAGGGFGLYDQLSSWGAIWDLRKGIGESSAIA